MLKFLLAFIGLIMTWVLLVTGLVKKDNKKLKKAGIIFVATWAILIVLGMVEFLFLANT